MNKEQRMVRTFHQMFDIETHEVPKPPKGDLIILRKTLIQEEFKELTAAMWNSDIIGIADGLADLLYVVYGTALACGIDIEPVFAEVHRSNMTKVGGHKREDGKWIKPDTYDPPNIEAAMEGDLHKQEKEAECVTWTNF